MKHTELCLYFHVKASDGDWIYETDQDIEVCNMQSLMEGKRERLWCDQ